jgi:hypothetical protein
MRIFLLSISNLPRRNFLVHEFLSVSGHVLQKIFHRFGRVSDRFQ